MHFYAQPIKDLIMISKKIILFHLLSISFGFILYSDLYEGFDFIGKKGLSLGDQGINSGSSSEGWMSSWQLGWVMQFHQKKIYFSKV